MEEGIVRALLYVLQAEGRFDERVAAAFRELHMRRSHLTRLELKRIVFDQAAVLQLDPQAAIESLAAIVPDDPQARTELLELVTRVVGITGALDAPVRTRLERIAETLSVKSVRETSPPKCLPTAPAKQHASET